MNKQKLKDLWIPVEILLDEQLSDKEKLILSMILYLSDETGSCFASNKYIASIVNVTSDRVSKIISSLKKKQYIEVKLKYKLDSKEVENRQIVPNKEKINMYSQKHIYSVDENNHSTSLNKLYPIGRNNKNIINNIKDKKIYNNDSSHNKKYKSNYNGRDYTNFDFTKLYANAEVFV